MHGIMGAEMTPVQPREAPTSAASGTASTLGARGCSAIPDKPSRLTTDSGWGRKLPPESAPTAEVDARLRVLGSVEIMRA